MTGHGQGRSTAPSIAAELIGGACFLAALLAAVVGVYGYFQTASDVETAARLFARELANGADVPGDLAEAKALLEDDYRVISGRRPDHAFILSVSSASGTDRPQPARDGFAVTPSTPTVVRVIYPADEPGETGLRGLLPTPHVDVTVAITAPPSVAPVDALQKTLQGARLISGRR